jgi:hypothetical protein
MRRGKSSGLIDEVLGIAPSGLSSLVLRHTWLVPA